MLTSNRKAIGQGLVQMLQGITNPSTGEPLYQFVKLGSLFDPSQYTAGLWAEVVYFQGKSGPAGSGGNLVGWRIEDDPIFLINTGYDYRTDSTAAMEAVLGAMDILLPALHSHYQIGAPGNPAQPIASVYSLLEGDQNDHGQPVRFPNGAIYYIWTTYALAKQQYNVQLAQV